MVYVVAVNPKEADPGDWSVAGDAADALGIFVLDEAVRVRDCLQAQILGAALLQHVVALTGHDPGLVKGGDALEGRVL